MVGELDGEQVLLPGPGDPPPMTISEGLNRLTTGQFAQPKRTATGSLTFALETTTAAYALGVAIAIVLGFSLLPAVLVALSLVTLSRYSLDSSVVEEPAR